MRESTILPILIDFEEPYNGSQKNNRRLHKEVSLLLYPRTVEVEHNRICTLVGIRYIRHKGWIDGIAPMRLFRIIEVDDIKLRLYLIGIQVMKQVIIGNLGKVGKLVIIDIHGKAFPNLLLDIVVHNGVGFTRPRSTQHH